MKTNAQPLRCLLIEDSENDALLVLHQLRTGGYDVTWERVETAEAMRAALVRQPWDFVISDYKMPSFSGTAALEVLKASGLDLPFILVSGTIGEETAVEMMKAGAHDYLLKGKLARLAPAVARELREVTVRREHQAAESALRLQSAALTAAANAIVLTDRDGTIVWANPAFTRLTGYAFAEALGRNPRALVKSDQQDRAVYPQLWQTILAGRVWRGELINRRKDGSVYPEEQTITPLRAADGAITHFIAVKQDLTERKKVEAEREQLLVQAEASRRALLSTVEEQKRVELKLRETAAELTHSLDKVSRFNAVAVGRELRMIELKREMNELCAKLGELPRFRVPAEAAPVAPEQEPPS